MITPAPFHVKVGAFLICGVGNISSDISSSSMQYVPQVYSRRVACLDTPYCCDIDCYITQTFCATILGAINRCVPRVNWSPKAYPAFNWKDYFHVALSAARDFYDLIRNLAKILVVGVIALLQLLLSIPQ